MVIYRMFRCHPLDSTHTAVGQSNFDAAWMVPFRQEILHDALDLASCRLILLENYRDRCALSDLWQSRHICIVFSWSASLVMSGCATLLARCPWLAVAVAWTVHVG